jgi:GrpB-like predicted nucleotidyltransferase (UPF0157 family)
MMRPLVVLNYDPMWPQVFAQLQSRIWPAISDVATTIEHVGSTSVPGLAAKPVIDMTIVVPAKSLMPLVIDRLASLGYQHRGDLGIPGREAFARPNGTPAHHLYACVMGNLGLRNHLAIRDYLRHNPSSAHTYGDLKRQAADAYGHDIDAYIDAKTPFLLEILTKAGLTIAELEEIKAINSK